MAYSTPILLLVFNRPRHTQKVLDRLRQLQPSRLFVSADGPRSAKEGEGALCQSVREVIAGIDWPCEVRTRYLDVNMGCRDAVRSGIDWFFSEVEEGVILEDDCLPNLSFFHYCSQLLEAYRDDTSIMHIGGNNPAAADFRKIPSSYVFSKYALIWGWATWRRAWQQYLSDFDGLEEAWSDMNSPLHQLDRHPAANRYMMDKFRRVRRGELNTWDYAWFYTLLVSGGLCIVPKVNLVENIGFDAAATHTGGGWRKKPETVQPMTFPVIPPANRQPDPYLESRIFRTSQKGSLGLLLRWLFPGYFFRPA